MKTLAASRGAPGVAAGLTYEWCVVEPFAPDGTSTGERCSVHARVVPATTPRVLECAGPTAASGNRLFESCTLAPQATGTTAACEGNPKTTGPWRATVIAGLFASKFRDTWVCAFPDHHVRACATASAAAAGRDLGERSPPGRGAGL